MDRSRRRFIERMSAAVLAGSGVSRCTSQPDTATERREDKLSGIDLLNLHPAFDLHTHPGMFPLRGAPGTLAEALNYVGDPGAIQTTEEMVAGQLAGGFFSLVADIKIISVGSSGIEMTRAFDPGEAWADYERQIGNLNKLFEILPADLATQVDDLEAYPLRGQVAAFVACEGGDCLEGEPERLSRMYDDGVRSLQLIHYAQNELGDLQTENPVYNGLSQVGREVVREMNRLGMVIDVAHASLATVRDIAAVSEAPLLLSHSQLKSESRQHDRLISVDHARVIADTGGVIGMWPSGFGNDTFDDFVDNTLRMVDVVGIEHVGLGTDMDGNYRPVFDSYLQLPRWADALLAKGLSVHDVGLLVGGNAARLLRSILH